MLSEKETEKLFSEYKKTKNIEIRNRLLENYLYLAEIVAKKFVGRGIEYDDLFQVASLALLKVIERFEPDRGIKFQSFATPSLVGEVKNYFRDKSRIIRLPRKNSEMLARLNEIRNSLENSLGRKPSVHEIADEMGVSDETILEIMEASSAINVIPIEKLVTGSDDTDYSNFIGKEETEFSKIDDMDFIKKSISRLSDEEKFIVSQRFIHGDTQKKVADKIGKSQMYVSRAENKILGKLRAMYTG